MSGNLYTFRTTSPEVRPADSAYLRLLHHRHALVLRRLAHRASRAADADRQAAGEEEEGGRADRGAAGQALLLGRGGPLQSQRLGAQGGPGRHRAGRRGVAGAARRRGRRAAAVPGPAARRAGDAQADGEVASPLRPAGRPRHLLPVVGAPRTRPLADSSACTALLHLHATHALLPPLARTGSTPTTRTRTGCSCARSQRC